MTTEPILDELAALARESRELDARRVLAAGEFAARSARHLEREGLSRRAGYARPALMLADLWQITVQEAQRFCDLGLATREQFGLDGCALPAEFPAVAAAIAAGEVGVVAAGVIVRELTAAATRCSTEQRLIAERELVMRAPDFSIADLHILARQVRDRLEEDGLLDRDAIRRARRALRFRRASHGMLRLEWEMGPETAGMVKAAIDGVVNADLHAARNGQLTDASTARAPGPTAGADVPAERTDERTLEQRRADAADRLFHHLATCATATGMAPATTVVVRLSLEDLRRGAGCASIDGIQETISIATARRLAADAELIPMVLAGSGEVLDAGRATRFFTRTQRLALIERDDGCAFAGCTSPPAYAEAHHIDWWSKGGTTDVSNGIMLCGFHHHRVHDDGWQICIHDHIPYFIPPPWIDPHQRPRQGGRIHLPEAA